MAGYMRCFLLTAILLLTLSSTRAQNINYIHYTTNNSRLPHDIVYRLHQDKAGYLWISTDDGLIRFDGTEMENFDKGFISKYVIDTEEENGRIWVCTWKGGIHVIKNDSAIHVKSAPGDVTFYSNNLLVFNDLVISYKFSSYIVLRYDSVKNLLLPYSLRAESDSLDILEPGRSDYFQFIKSGKHRLYAYNSQGIFEVRHKKLVKLPTTIKPDCIWNSPSGELYYMQGKNIYLTNPDFSVSRLIYSISSPVFKNKEAVSFRVLPSGNVCVGFKSIELHNGNPLYYLINTRTSEIIDFSKEVVGEALSADLIVDKEGNLWMSTDGRGLYHIFDLKFKQIGGDISFENSTVTDLQHIGKDSLFIGTKEGLYLYANNEIKFLKNPKRLSNTCIRRLFITEKGNIGLVNSDVFPSYTFSNNQFIESDAEDRKLFNHYVYTRDRVKGNSLTYTDGKRTEKIRDPKLDVCEFFAEDADTTLWLATNEDLWFYHPHKGFQLFRDPKLDGILINCILFQKNKGLWIGSNKGLFLIHRQRNVEYFGINEGLLNLNIRCLYSDNTSALWIGTQNGLFNYRDTKFTIYKRRDGLIADDVNCMEALNEKELALGSSKGVTLFALEIPAKEILPVAKIEKLLVNDQERDWRVPIHVPYDNSISLKYNAITFVYPELLVFAYRLHENEPWITTQNKSLVFTDLKPGTYRLELKVKKYNTSYSAPVSIDFQIHSPWWRSIYFFIGLFTACIVLVYIILKLQLSKQKRNAILTLELAELKMKALQAQLNPHFISNALNTIQYFILTRDEIAANNYLAQFTDLTRLFLEVSRNRFINLKTELDLLENYLSLEKLRFEKKFDYSVDLDPSIDLSQTFIPGLIMQPFVENSINHGIVYLPKEKMGLISISIKKLGEDITITINDNGIGRKKAKEIKNRLAKSYRSHASQILEELKQAYNLIPGCLINIETFDKESPEKESLGTCVYIKIRINTLHLN